MSEHKKILSDAIEFAMSINKKNINRRCYYLINILAGLETEFPILYQQAQSLKGLYHPTDRTLKALHAIVNS